MEAGFFGGILDRDAAERRRLSGITPFVEDDAWTHVNGNRELFLYAAGSCCRLYSWGPLALLVRGPIACPASRDPLDLDLIAESLRHSYLEDGFLDIEGLEGAFSLVLMDGQVNRVLVYRHLAGNGCVYYHPARSGLLFGSNLAALVEANGETPGVNESALPAYFLNRFVPGRETLFDGFRRLLPGEQLQLADGRLTLVLRRAIADFRESLEITHNAEDRLDALLEQIFREYRQLHGHNANLLSGGVDSSVLQIYCNRTLPAGSTPATFCLTVDHPRCEPDRDYALSAAKRFHSRHTLVPTPQSYASYLLDSLASTGEPPNHVQLAYFGHLARTMVQAGSPTGVCGEGADSLFGLTLASQIQMATWARRLLPLRPLRRFGAWLAQAVGWRRLHSHLEMASILGNPRDFRHPVNQAQVFADWPAVLMTFGEEAVASVCSSRRHLLDEYQISDDPLERSHFAGYLGSGVNTAALKTTLFNQAGAELLFPFLDSRIIRFAVNLSPSIRFPFRKPKEILRQLLVRNGHAGLANRPKLGFGQPIFEWLAPGGKLRPLVEQIHPYDFVHPGVMRTSLQQPNWFLYSLLCFDLWYKLFIERSLPRSHAPEFLEDLARSSVSR